MIHPPHSASPPTVRYLTELRQLFEVFERAERGESVALVPTGVDPACLVLPPARAGGGASLGVTSSGSTGVPKTVWVDWRDLSARLNPRPDQVAWRWASPYQPWTFAGVQVALQAWRTGGKIISLSANWPEAWRSLSADRIEAISATPTYLDLLVQNEPAGFQTYCPRQVTLGGEPLRPGVGLRLAGRFARARFTAIYASAELGVLAKTHRTDGWYEIDSLARSFPRWRAERGSLAVQRHGAWVATGDLVEVEGPLFRVVGRADNVANVAGTKVSLDHISELAEQVPGVLRAVAVAEPNPITGQIVALRYAVSPSADGETITGNLQAYLRRNLPKEAWPRRWVVDDLGPARNAKRSLA